MKNKRYFMITKKFFGGYLGRKHENLKSINPTPVSGDYFY
jgi:hypothetical protein